MNAELCENLLPLREKVAAEQPDEGEVDDFLQAGSRGCPPLPVDSADHPLPQGERVSREAVVAAARSWIGTPYRHQGALKGVGCDCLGLLIGVWRELHGDPRGKDAVAPGISAPAYTSDWAEAIGQETFAEGLREHLTEIERSEVRAGDIVLFRWRAHLPAKHAAILTARDRMVHAQEKCTVAEVPLSDWWKRRMAFAFAFPARAVSKN